MKFLVDNQLPLALAVWLRRCGHDAVHVLERGEATLDDRTLWETARRGERIMVSKDEDFFILATRPDDDGSLLWIRLGNCRTRALISALERTWGEIEGAFGSGQRVVEVR